MYSISEIIKIMNKYTTQYSELGEQADVEATPKSNVTVWSSGATRGKANPLMTKDQKWDSGASRGLANPISNQKWSDNYSIKRGAANPLP